MPDTWDDRISAIWADDTLDEDETIDAIDAVAAERPRDDPRALFERAGARDSAGREADAESLYRRALAGGLDDEHRPQAVIQLASTIRNLGKTDEALRILRDEYERDAASPFHDAAAAFYALALSSAGREREALAIALTALAPHLPRYTRSVTGYARELVQGRA
jgi:tetratricopeptide (TPR) repeat protein